MIYTNGKEGRTNCLAWFGVSIYFDFGARLFPMQWPPDCAHILQGLLNKLITEIGYRAALPSTLYIVGITYKV